jgi:hypothetical protein
VLRFFGPRAGGALLTLLASVALAAPAAAVAAPAVTLPSACYVSWPGQIAETIPIRASGLLPGALVTVQLRIMGQTVSGLPSLTVDGAGNLVTELKSWTTGLDAGPTHPLAARIVITDLLLGTELAATDLKVANVGLEIDSSTQNYATKRRWVVSGLGELGGGPSYWAHYFKGTKEIARVKIGTADDTCGYLLTKRVLIPFDRLGKFVVSVQASRTYDKTLPSLSYKVRGYKK